ncbi:hypothetical protein CASFOL_033657 [Castilleja foliolosa]|uniref:Embryo defective 1703 n=1 Tax=Castilleja foliolosa TaxID=1961234 RepID=A0ABD3BYR2_9LAMI
MEFLHSTILPNPQVSPAIPFLTWKNRINPSRVYYIPSSRKSHIRPSFSLNPFCSVFPSNKSRISARFGRPNNRQNYLRKKLTQQQQQQQVRHIQSPVQKFDSSSKKIDDVEENLENESKSDSLREGSMNIERVSQGVCLNDSESVKESETELSKNKIGESVMWSKLENWVEQYKKDSEFWGIGTNPIFNVFQNSKGEVERVVVNEDEIMKRSRVDPRLDKETQDLVEFNYKVSFAKDLAREMEKGNNVIPNNSTVAKFLPSGGESRFTEMIRGITLKPGLFPRMPRVGLFVLCGFCVIWAIRGFLVVGKESKEYTSLEKEMLRRKMKARSEKEKMVKGSVEIVQATIEPKSVSFKRPQLDKDQLANSIVRAMESTNEPGIVEYNGFQNKEYENEIEEIRAMARNAREIERLDSSPGDVDKENSRGLKDSYQTTESNSFMDEDIDKKFETGFNDNPNVMESSRLKASNMELVPKSSDLNEKTRPFEDPGVQSGPREISSRKKLRIIKSAEEARDYLSRKQDKLDVDLKHDDVKNMDSVNDLEKSRISSGEEVSISKKDTEAGHNPEDTENSEMLGKNRATDEYKDRSAGLAPSVNKISWLEKNFHEFEPVVEKIGVGFRENYWVAREKASQEMDLKNELTQLKSDDNENELEWMKDERLREIVFKVRDNELSGRDPFHLMGEKDKRAFFSGLEKKVQQENEKLVNLHEYFHSNIENLDYGADGISLYDPPEKIIPRWKNPPAETNPEFLKNFVEQRKSIFAESLENSSLLKKTEKDTIHKSENPSNKPIKEPQKDNSSSPKTVIHSSDGSVRPGKKSGKEFWQHTKKWSEGFLESYNAETDPEAKAEMRNIGKDLDRWITEKEIKEAADLMDKIPEKGQKFIKGKLDKVKREMELFGPQAVVSKYREYAEEKEEDYLWWLDLNFVLCIEMYTVEDNEQRVGFYSLEMAADLELDPKQYHVIAFEDAGDCKNLCYIIQAHMEMLANGNAFVVARPPKDAFREAKSNGFNVTVIRKGQLQLNIDQTLEEVEGSIVEIGSKIYHDQITKEHNVNIDGLMKGVFGVSKSAKSRKRSKRKSKKRIKS